MDQLDRTDPARIGLGLVFVNVLVEQAGLPVPAYPTLIIAGAYLDAAASTRSSRCCWSAPSRR